MPFFEKKYEFLFEFNLELTILLLKMLKIKKAPIITEAFEKEYDNRTDLRSALHPKRERLTEPLPYPQVFADRQPFTDRVSVIDLLFNIGPEATNHLNQRKVLR